MPQKAKTFDQETYKKISLSDLIIFVMNLLAEKKEKCAFEKLVKECFLLFPKAFSFSQYPQWPDSRKLDRPLRLLRKRKMIKGDPSTFFVLTKEGKKRGQEAAKIFFQRKLFK